MIKLRAIARLGASLIAEGHRVLSHCGMGFNRSAFVAGIDHDRDGHERPRGRLTAARATTRRAVQRRLRRVPVGAQRASTSDHLSRSAGGTALARLQGMTTILLVVLILMLLGAVPAWPHSRNWGYGPSSGLGLVVLILLVLVLTGRL